MIFKPPAMICAEPTGGDFDVPSVLLITICDPISHDFTMRTAESGAKSPRFGSANLTSSNPFYVRPAAFFIVVLVLGVAPPEIVAFHYSFDAGGDH